MLDAVSGTDLHRRSTADELAELLRDLILRGDLAPDEPMREAALADRFEVSRRSVREALSLLEHAGLVRHHRHKGTRVTRLDADDIRDLYRVRGTLELAAARAAGSAPYERRVALEQAFQRLSEATRLGHAEEIVARDLEFHQATVGLLGSARIDQFFADVALEMRYALSILEASQHESKRRPKAALDEHRAIYEALLAGNRSTATRLISEHIDVNERLLIDAVTPEP